MRNDDFKNIPATRVTLSSSGTSRRNESIVSVSGYRSKGAGKPGKAPRAADNRSGKQDGYFEAADDRRSGKQNDYFGDAEDRNSGRYTEPASRKPHRARRAADENISREERRTEERSFGAFIAEIIVSVLLLASATTLTTIQSFASNVEYMSFGDLKPMWVYMVASILIFCILRIFLRKPYFAALFVAFGAFFAVNLMWLVEFMRLFFNEFNSAAIGAIILYVVLLAGFFFLLRLLYSKKLPLNAVAKILTAVFTGLVVVNVIMAFIAIDNYKNSSKVASVVQPDPTATPTVAVPTPAVNANTPTGPDSFGKPNIYFFVMDEFSSFDMLKKYYGYDAKPFNDFLDVAGFNLSRVSYSSDNQTEHCFADLFNLDYISRKLSKETCVKKIQKGSLHEVLKGLGYTEYQIGNRVYFKGIKSLTSSNQVDDPNEEDEPGNISDDFSTVGTEDITNQVGTIIGNLLGDRDADTKVNEKALNDFGFYPTEYIRSTKAYKNYKNKDSSKIAKGDFNLNAFDYFRDPSNYANKTSPRITYCYMLATHVPFVFNEYGGIISFNKNRDWEDKDVYLNQYKFFNKQFISTITSIIKNDPKSIIIVMSDHGVRYHAEDNLRLKMNFVISDKDSCRIMNAVYIKGQKHNIEGLSGVNTLRYIMSLYEGQEQDFPPIKDPITPDSPSCLKGIIPHSRHN